MALPYQHSARRPAGYAYSYAESGALIEGDTVQCIHCQGHRYVIDWRLHGSPMCMNCMGPICGDTPECAAACCHWEKELLAIERAARK